MNKNIDIKVIKANTFFRKLIGVMFKKEKLDYGILFYNTRSIHTFFCFQSIDIIMLDKDYKVLYTFPNTKKNKIISKEKKVYYTLEVPKGFILENNIHTNDILYLTNLEK